MRSAASPGLTAFPESQAGLAPSVRCRCAAQGATGAKASPVTAGTAGSAPDPWFSIFLDARHPWVPPAPSSPWGAPPEQLFCSRRSAQSSRGASDASFPQHLPCQARRPPGSKAGGSAGPGPGLGRLLLPRLPSPPAPGGAVPGSALPGAAPGI